MVVFQELKPYCNAPQTYFWELIRDMPLKKKQKIKTEKFKFDTSDIYIGDTFEELDFEGCCGARVFIRFPEPSDEEFAHDFKEEYQHQYDVFIGQEDRWYADRKRPPKLPNSFWKNIYISKIEQDLERECGKNNDLTITILNEHQLWVKPCLIKNGFRLVSDRNVNKRTGNRLYTFIRDPETKKEKRVNPKKGFFKSNG